MSEGCWSATNCGCSEEEEEEDLGRRETSAHLLGFESFRRA